MCLTSLVALYLFSEKNLAWCFSSHLLGNEFGFLQSEITDPKWAGGDLIHTVSECRVCGGQWVKPPEELWGRSIAG